MICVAQDYSGDLRCSNRENLLHSFPIDWGKIWGQRLIVEELGRRLTPFRPVMVTVVTSEALK